MCNPAPGGNGPAGDQRIPHRQDREEEGQRFHAKLKAWPFVAMMTWWSDKDNLIVAQNLHKFST